MSTRPFALRLLAWICPHFWDSRFSFSITNTPSKSVRLSAILLHQSSRESSTYWKMLCFAFWLFFFIFVWRPIGLQCAKTSMPTTYIRTRTYMYKYIDHIVCGVDDVSPASPFKMCITWNECARMIWWWGDRKRERQWHKRDRCPQSFREHFTEIRGVKTPKRSRRRRGTCIRSK